MIDAWTVDPVDVDERRHFGLNPYVLTIPADEMIRPCERHKRATLRRTLERCPDCRLPPRRPS